MTTTEHMTNDKGHLVPIELVRDVDMLTHQLVMGLFQSAVSLSADLRTFKQTAFEEVDTLLDLLAEKYQAKLGGKKGNVTLTSYDGRFRIQVSIGEFIQFGPELQVAKTLIDECIREWSDGSNINIQALVFDAFRVDKNNRLNVDRILGLRRINIKDDRWKRAMDAISNSVQVTSSKRYVRFYKRDNPEAEWHGINLDLASV